MSEEDKTISAVRVENSTPVLLDLLRAVMLLSIRGQVKVDVTWTEPSTGKKVQFSWNEATMDIFGLMKMAAALLKQHDLPFEGQTINQSIIDEVI